MSVHNAVPLTKEIDPFDAETVTVEPVRLGGPVDAPDEAVTLYGTIVRAREHERAPIVPAWMRNPEQRKQVTRWALGTVGYVVGWHAWHSPKYAGKLAWYAPRGAGRFVWRQVRWMWSPELNRLMQAAADDGDVVSGVRVNTPLVASRKARAWMVGGEAIGLAVAVMALTALAPLWAQWAAAAAVVPVLARLGRPADKPIVDRTSTGPRFTKLTGEMVRLAMCSIGVAGIKEPESITFPPPGIHRDGPGWLARINLPQGVEAVDVMERRGRLSSALRLPVDQVWPAAGPDHAGQVDLWVGYIPASRMGQPKFSLLAENARCSVFERNEFGSDERQRPVSTALMFRNFLLGGAPGSGKSYGARSLLYSAALDPICELKIAEYKGTADFGDFAHLCSTYICGIDDNALEAGRAMVAWGLAEAERRGERIRKAKENGQAPEGKVTPELAAKPGSGLHPILMMFDEAHELFLHDKQIAKDMERLIKRGRALGIIIVLATQIPDSKSVPPNITRCVVVRWCMAVPDQIANDMILGTGAYKRGLSATVYRPEVDAGWGVAIGLEQSGPVRSHFPSPTQAAAIIARATALRGGVVAGEQAVDVYTRDVLDDVITVFATFGRRGLHWQKLAALLAEAHPDVYRGMTPETVSSLMRDKGVPSEQVKVDGVNLQGCKLAEVQAAAARRELTSG